VSAQAGRGTQWIGAWALTDRLVQIPGYFLLGANGSVLGHGLLALAALPLLAAVVLAYLLLRRGALTRAQIEAGALVLGLGVVAILIPVALALVGKDYFAPRNLIADWVPLSAALALVLAAGGRAGRRCSRRHLPERCRRAGRNRSRPTAGAGRLERRGSGAGARLAGPRDRHRRARRRSA
jgi:hypothetical protein